MIRICTICARAGSKGVKNKNLRELGGKPLIAHSIEHAKNSGLFDAIAVSSDSAHILETAGRFGAEILVVRPVEMATDEAPKLPAMKHCGLKAEEQLGRQADVFVDLDATAPLRRPEDIVGAVALLEAGVKTNVITGAPARRSPYFNLVERDDSGIVRLSKPPGEQIARRQDSPQCFDMNASIYVWTRKALMSATSVFNEDTRLYVMPEERSIDIDSELDFVIVEYLLSRNT